MIPDHGNPHEKPGPIEPAPPLSCACGFKLTTPHADMLAKNQWRCPTCGRSHGLRGYW
jgi:hypothetical protein